MSPRMKKISDTEMLDWIFHNGADFQPHGKYGWKAWDGEVWHFTTDPNEARKAIRAALSKSRTK